MHLRRALILFALVLGLTALAASIAPPSREEKPAPTTPAPAQGTDPVEAETLTFRAGLERKEPAERKVAPDQPVTVVVHSDEAGQATIPGLGRLDYASETVPARFNLLSPPAGRYRVMFEPTGGEIRRVGTVVSE